MKPRHKTLISAGLGLFLLGWLAWMMLLTESEEEVPAAVDAAP